MTVETQLSQVMFTGIVDGVPLTLDFPVLNAEHVSVVYGDDTEAVYGVDYSVQLTPPLYETATVTPLTGFAATSGGTINVARVVPYLQPFDILTMQRIGSTKLEEAQDYQVMIGTQLRDTLDRTLKFPRTDPETAKGPIPRATLRAGKAAGYDGVGKPTVLSITGGVIDDAGLVNYVPTWAGAIVRSVRDRLMDRIDIRDFGAIGDNVTDNTQAFQDAADAVQEIAEALGVDADSQFAAATVSMPAGRFRMGPVRIGNIRFEGVGWQNTRIVGLDAQQPYLFSTREDDPGARIGFEHCELMGWHVTGTPADYPDNVLVLEDGTYTLQNCRFSRGKGLVWAKRGNDLSLDNVAGGFFPEYGLKFGGIDNGIATTLNITAASWLDGVRTLTVDGGAPDLNPYDVLNTIAGMGNVAWNGVKQRLLKGSTGNTLKIASPVDPGAPGALGTIQYSKSEGAAISETRINGVKMYSGAASMYGPASTTPDPVLAEGAGRQIILDTDCGATVITNTNGGDTAIGIEIIDSLILGNRRTAGFVHAELYTSGVNRLAGVWIKGNGGNTEWIGSKFSAPNDDAGCGMIVDSPNAAVALSGCTFQNCRNNGLRIERAFSVVENGSVYRDIGRAATDGIALHCVTGLTKIRSSGIVYAQHLQSLQPTDMKYAVKCGTNFRGDVHIAASQYADLSVTAFFSTIDVPDWVVATVYQIDDVITKNDLFFICLEEHTSVVFADDKDAGKWEECDVGLNAYDNNDIVVVPPRSSPAQIREYKARHPVMWITQPFEQVFNETIDWTGLSGNVFITWGTSPIIYSDADTILKIGGMGGGEGGGWKAQESDINIKGELFITRDAAAAGDTIGVEIVADTYDVNIDYIRVDKVGTAIRAPLGPIHGIHIGKLYFFDCVDGGADFFSSAPLDEIGHVTIGWIDANTRDAMSWAIGVSIGPNVGSGGKTSVLIEGGIIYRHRHAIHFWGVQNVISATYDAGTGFATITMAKAHYKAPGDSAIFGNFDQAQANGTFTLEAGSTGRVFVIDIADPGVLTLTGKGWYTVDEAITQVAGINFDAPRKARIDNITIRGPNNHGIYIEGGADIHIFGVTIDDAGIFSVYAADTVSLTYDGGSGEIVVELDPDGDGHDCLVGEYFTIKRSQATLGSYNGTWLCSAVDDDHTLRALIAADPGTATQQGIYYHPEDTVTSGLYVDKFFHGKLTVDAGQIHESNGPGITWNAIHAIGLYMASMVQWNGSWGATGAAPNTLWAEGHSNVFLEDCSFGISDHWRHANKTPTMSGVPAVSTLTLGGTVISFVNGAPATAYEVQRDGGVTLAQVITALATLVNTSLDTQLQKITVEPVPNAAAATGFKITHNQPGASGSAFTLATTAAAITLGGGTLGGGTGAQTGTWALDGFVGNIRGNRAINVRGEGISGVYSKTQPPAIDTTARAIDVTDNVNAALRVTQRGSGLTALFEDNNSPDATPYAIDATGNHIVGATAQQAFAGGALPKVQLVSASSQDLSSYGIQNWSGTITIAPTIRFAKSRGGVVGTHSIVSSATVLGRLPFSGSDGVAFIPAAEYRVEMDGAPGVNDMPAKHIWATTPAGAAAFVDRWQIGNLGMLRCLHGSFGRLAPVTKTADFTVATNENWLINDKAAATCTVTLPSAASFIGREIMIKNLQAFTVVSASANVVPLAGGAAGTAILAAVAGRWCTLVSDGVNWVQMNGVV